MINAPPGKTKNAHFIKGPAGQLEVAREKALGKEREAIGIICHPHPQFGGTMQNKVVTTLAKTFQYLGVQTIRFNFRGVGLSEGEFARGEGELEDLLAVIKWVCEERPDFSLWLAGFSFGAYIAASAAVQVKTEKLVLVAPPVTNFPMQNLPPIQCPWVLVQGERDEVVSPQAVLQWAASRDPQPHMIKFPQADHFFHGQLGELRARLEEVLGA